MACKGNGFTITWLIENYDFFCERSGQGFYSLPFVIKSIEHTSWTLYIVANSATKPGHIVFDVSRRILRHVIELELDFEISFFSERDSSPVFEKSYSYTYKNSDNTLRCHVPHNEVYERRVNILIPPGTLTIRCKIFNTKGSFLEADQCYACTRIQVERAEFIGFKEHFSNMVNFWQALTMMSPSPGKRLLSSNLKMCNENISIQIIPISTNYVKFCKLKFFLLDSKRKTTECGEGENSFIETREWSFSLVFNRDYLMSLKTHFLSNDTLYLKCEFAFSTGVEHRPLEYSECSNIDIATENHPKLSCILENLICLYKEGILCDMKLQTATETFNVHKNILSARSSVFKSMFSTDMREKTTECVIIEDLEANTVHRMLLYMYSDRLEDLDLESSKSLYFAADKYNIVTLKHRCSDFLKSNLQPSKCCELLLLSDRHQDKELKRSVLKYMGLYRDTILHSEQWTNLEKNNPVLAIETFRAIYLGK